MVVIIRLAVTGVFADRHASGNVERTGVGGLHLRIDWSNENIIPNKLLECTVWKEDGRDN